MLFDDIYGIVRVELECGRMAKEAESDADRAELGHEIRALRACAHPGVIALLGSEGGEAPGRLVLARPAGGSWADAEPRSVALVAGQAAAIASTLADLHELGWAHGSLTPEHVLLDERGRPVLTGFSHTVGPDQAEELPDAQASDVAALAAMTLDRVPPGADRRLIRMLSAAGGTGRRGRPLTARQLGRRLIDMVPSATLDPGADRPEDRGRSEEEHRPGVPSLGHRTAGLLMAAGLIAGGLVIAGVWGLHRPGTGLRPDGPMPSSVPAGSPAPSRPSVAAGDRFVLAGPAEGRLLTVEGRWGCGTTRPASLDPASGWVWAFARWPAAGATLNATPVARVPDAVGLAVRAERPGCDDLVVLTRSGGGVAVPVSRLTVSP